jgi:hypothetical protein
MQETWAQFAKDPGKGLPWKIGELGHFGYDGKLRADSPTKLDRYCDLYEELYEGRA